jgi:hypothetical protein|tara:strand:- start:593 stop:838 length:246 start_codon:yes stop_codon:yes gene_type:complete
MYYFSECIRSGILQGRSKVDTAIWSITGLFIAILILGIVFVVSENLFHISNLGFYAISFSMFIISIVVIGVTIGTIIQKRF